MRCKRFPIAWHTVIAYSAGLHSGWRDILRSPLESQHPSLQLLAQSLLLIGLQACSSGLQLPRALRRQNGVHH